MQITHQIFSSSQIKAAILLTSWCSFLLFGIYTASQVSVLHSSLMHVLLHSHMSIVSLACVVLLPFFYSIVAFRLNQFYLVIPVVCIKAFTFGYSCSLISVLFGNAGWLMRWLLVYTDSILVIPLLCYWLRNTIHSIKTAYQGIGGYLFLTSMLLFVEYFYIEPIITKLSECTM